MSSSYQTRESISNQPEVITENSDYQAYKNMVPHRYIKPLSIIKLQSDKPVYIKPSPVLPSTTFYNSWLDRTPDV